MIHTLIFYSIRIGGVIFLLIISHSCTQRTSPLEPIFERVKNSFDNDKLLEDIKVASLDSFDVFFPFFRYEFEKVLTTTNASQEIDDWFDAELVPANRSLRDSLLFIAFQNYLKKGKIIFKDIQDAIENERKRKVKQKELQRQKILSIIRTNDTRWKEGDTINLTLELSIDREYYLVKYKDPYSLYYFKPDDTLKMKGVLISKIFKDHTLTISKDTSLINLVFNLKILKLNHHNVYSIERQLKEGGEFNLYLRNYDRLIEE